MKKNRQIVYLTELAVLLAVMLVLELTGLGMIKTFGLEMTILQIPVIIGAILLGPSGGLILGTAFGLISFFECFGKSVFGSMLLSINPFLTFLVCVPTRALMGWLCGLIFQALNRRNQPSKRGILPYLTASLCGAFLNTIFFMGVLCLCFYQTDYIQSFVKTLGTTNVLSFVILFVGLQGFIEALVCAALGTVISKAAHKSLRRE